MDLKWRMTISMSWFNVKLRDNYTLLICGLPLILCTDLWFQFWHFIHLWLSPWVCRNPPLLKLRVNRYFCTSFMSLLPKQKIAQKCKRKKIKKWYLFLFPFTQILNMMNIPKKKKNPDQPITDLMKHLQKIITL